MSNPQINMITRPTLETGLAREREKTSHLPPFAKNPPAIMKMPKTINAMLAVRTILGLCNHDLADARSCDATESKNCWMIFLEAASIMRWPTEAMTPPTCASPS